MKFAFISRHTPSAGQIQLAAEKEIELLAVGDCDGFTVSPAFVYEAGPFEGVVVVHPAAALNLAPHFLVGVFENENRAAIGERPDFHAKSFKIWDLRD